jgi:hypothetical protein
MLHTGIILVVLACMGADVGAAGKTVHVVFSNHFVSAQTEVGQLCRC